MVRYGQKQTRMSIMKNMPSKPPVIFPQEQRMLTQLGERIRLARLRRQLSAAAVAGRAGISRTSLYKAELGNAGVTLGTYLRVLAVLGLERDLDAVAADDKVGRKLQDLMLPTRAPRPRLQKAGNTSSSTTPQTGGPGQSGSA